MIILSSRGFQNPAITRLILERSRGLLGRACVVTTAALPLKETGAGVQRAHGHLREALARQVEYLDLETADPGRLRGFDLIYLAGGDSGHLFAVVQASGADALLRELAGEGTILMGSSAGAQLLSAGNAYNRDFNALLGLEERAGCRFNPRGLGLTDHVLLPHYDRFVREQPGLETMVQALERRDGLRITRMNDNGYIVRTDAGAVIERLD